MYSYVFAQRTQSCQAALSGLILRTLFAGALWQQRVLQNLALMIWQQQQQRRRRQSLRCKHVIYGLLLLARHSLQGLQDPNDCTQFSISSSMRCHILQQLCASFTPLLLLLLPCCCRCYCGAKRANQSVRCKSKKKTFSHYSSRVWHFWDALLPLHSRTFCDFDFWPRWRKSESKRSTTI